MILSDIDLKLLQEDGCFPKTCKVGPSSVDLTLSSSYAKVSQKLTKIRLSEEELPYEHYTSDLYLLQPDEFILASTTEYIRVPDTMAAYVEGRSSIGRIGVQVQNAGFIDAGFEGQITLELKNQTKFPIELPAGMRICQLVYVQMTQKAQAKYSGKYVGQRGATGSRIIQDYLNY